MRVICPYVELHPDTIAALTRYAKPEYWWVGNSDTAYASLLRQLWADGEAFAIIEQDVVPTGQTLREFAHCPEPYCASPYAWTTHLAPALGCTRFSSLLLRAYPDAMEIAAHLPSAYGERGHYRQLDVHLMNTVLRDHYGLQPHCHAPVEHRNPEKQLVAGARVTTRVEARSHVPAGLVEDIAAVLTAHRDGPVS